MHGTAGFSGHNSPAHLMLEIAKLMRDRQRIHFQEIGLHRSQAFVLRELWHADGIPQSELVEALHVSPPTITNILQRMEKSGWIKRRPDDRDQRVSRVYLTNKARALRSRVGRAFRDLEEELLTALTPAERETFDKLLGKLRESALALRCCADRDREKAG